MGGKFKFSAQDSNLEYLFWRSKNLPVSSDIIPPKENGNKSTFKNWNDKLMHKMEIVLPKRALYDSNSCTYIHTSR